MQKECRLMYAHLNMWRVDAKMEGRDEGKREGKRETARAMLADHLPIATIVHYTGLTQDEVLALQ